MAGLKISHAGPSMLLSVITRTLGRPRLLTRAARSVASAQIPEMEWILVEDQHSLSSETEQIASDVSNINVQLIAGGGRGRTAAANLGLRAAQGTFVHFHDDDDTVEPDFYRVLLSFLAETPRYRGARAFCRRIYERMEQDEIRTIKTRRVYPERRVVSLMAAAEVFAYPPIGSIFERAILLEIGGFDETFDVGEDYELLLRFLMQADMGTYPACLANVHVRPHGKALYANSPMAWHFTEEDALFRDTLLRRDLVSGQFGLGFLLALGSQSRQRRTLLQYLDAARRRMGL